MLLLLVAGEAAYWRFAAERLRAGYQEWLDGLAAQGWNVASGSPSISGWPRAATVSVPGLTLRHAGPAVPGDLEVAAAGVTLSVSLLSSDDLGISLTGPTHIRVADTPDLVLTAKENRISTPLRESGSTTIDVQAKGVRIEPAAGGWQATAGLLNGRGTFMDEMRVGEVKAGEVKAGSPEPAATFGVSAEAIVLPEVIKWPLGARISSLSLDGVLNGPLPPARDITDWAKAWRDGGGSLAITHFTLGWGPLGLTSSATLALDDQLQPMGSGNGRVVGYAATLDQLAAAGVLTKSAATAAKAVLSLLAGAGGESDEPSAVDVPLTLQYRTLSMRQVPLVRLPELDWPAH